MPMHSANVQRWIMKWTISTTSKLRTVCVIVGLAMTASGCARFSCSGFAPIYVSKADKLTDGTAKAILKHDEYGAKLGCSAFKPKSKFF